MGLLNTDFDIEDEFDDMEMPTPCQKCDEWFDLNDGVGSEKWYPGTVICPECGEKEDNIIELEREIEDLQDDIDQAEDDILTANQTISENKSKIEELKEKLKKLEDE